MRCKELDSTLRKLRDGLIVLVSSALSEEGATEASVRAQIPGMLSKLSGGMCDLNRYTVAFPKDTFVEGSKAVIKACGVAVKVKNFFGDGSCYFVRILRSYLHTCSSQRFCWCWDEFPTYVLAKLQKECVSTAI
jgi:hypothetical protein